MTKHAIIGSRKHPDLEAVTARLDDLHARNGSEWLLVSGGAGGVCWEAEQGHLARGGRVISFRPFQQGDEDFRVHEWRMPDGGMIEHDITFMDWTSAAMYRSMLIAERSDHGDAYWDGHSRGTMFEIDAFVGAGKKLTVHRTEEAPSWAS